MAMRPITNNASLTSGSKKQSGSWRTKVMLALGVGMPLGIGLAASPAAAFDGKSSEIPDSPTQRGTTDGPASLEPTGSDRSAEIAEEVSFAAGWGNFPNLPTIDRLDDYDGPHRPGTHGPLGIMDAVTTTEGGVTTTRIDRFGGRRPPSLPSMRSTTVSDGFSTVTDLIVFEDSDYEEKKTVRNRATIEGDVESNVRWEVPGGSIDARMESSRLGVSAAATISIGGDPEYVLEAVSSADSGRVAWSETDLKLVGDFEFPDVPTATITGNGLEEVVGFEDWTPEGGSAYLEKEHLRLIASPTPAGQGLGIVDSSNTWGAGVIVASTAKAEIELPNGILVGAEITEDGVAATFEQRQIPGIGGGAGSGASADLSKGESETYSFVQTDTGTPTVHDFTVRSDEDSTVVSDGIVRLGDRRIATIEEHSRRGDGVVTREHVDREYQGPLSRSIRY